MAISYFSAEGLKKLQEEVHNLKVHARARIASAISEAREKGDLSENAEYEAAKEAQGLLEIKISKMEEILSSARIMDESKIDANKILVLSKVKIKNLSNQQTMNYTLVTETEADMKAGKISVNSPIGKGLLGKSLGDTVEITVPSGKIKFEVMEVSR
jgi:transcription elongation factor GreA